MTDTIRTVINNSDGTRTKKSPKAFRTISEAAGELGLPQHVLRFWETKFPQIKPMKRAGGRRFYRPEDVELLNRIKTLLHTEGYTIKGVQKLLRQNGQGADHNIVSPKPENNEQTAEPDGQQVRIQAEINAAISILESAHADLLSVKKPS